jgi:hypothetical protein
MSKNSISSLRGVNLLLPVVVDDELEDEGRVAHHIVQFHHLARDLSLQCSPSQKNLIF